MENRTLAPSPPWARGGLSDNRPLLGLCIHPRQPTKRSERAERDQFEAHKIGLAERQLLKHLMGGGKISDAQDEHHSLAILLRVTLIDLTIQIEVPDYALSSAITLW